MSSVEITNKSLIGAARDSFRSFFEKEYLTSAFQATLIMTCLKIIQASHSETDQLEQPHTQTYDKASENRNSPLKPN